MGYGLGLHTSGFQLGLALDNFNGDSRWQGWDLDRELSNYLHLSLQTFLHPQKWQDLAFIAVAKGPGSFTSTRIGVVTARTLAQQLNLPLYGISTLAAYAWSRKDHFDDNALIATQLPATRGQVYGAIYQLSPDGFSLVPRFEDTVLTPHGWEQILQQYNISDNLLKLPDKLGENAINLLQLGYNEYQQGKKNHWSEIVPYYGMSVV